MVIRRPILWILFTLILCPPLAALAEGRPAPSSTLMGPIGLNNIPSARMDKAGTVRIGAGAGDPYLHSFAGFQLSEFLYVGVRQTAEKSSLLSAASNHYPGVDFKIRLKEEGRYDPAMVVGFMSAFGHKQTASEYLAFSKRWHALDFTFGMAWGRLAGKGHIDNPLKRTSSHFGKERTFGGDESNSPDDWFTGERAGFFAGLEYATPVKGLSVKADWGANPDGLEATTVAGYDAPEPWSLALSYQPAPWIDGMIGVAGTDKIMARLSLQSNVMHWAVSPFTDTPAPALFRNRTTAPDAENAQKDSRQGGLYLSNIRVRDSIVAADLQLDPNKPLPYQLGRAARYIANHAGPAAETISITPLYGLIKGRPVSVLRRDLEQALRHHQGSPDEIWHNTVFDPVVESGKRDHGAVKPWAFSIALENDLDFSAAEADYLYRVSALFRLRSMMPYGFFSGTDIRLNIADNLGKLDPLAVPFANPVRADIADYAGNLFYLDRAYLGWRGMMGRDLFTSITLGAIEEMFAGAGGEILYRPFGKSWAVGAEAWQVYKRDPDNFAGDNISDYARFTGHLNFWYEVPESDLTFSFKAGQFIGEDTGATFGLDHVFQNGVGIGGHISVSRDYNSDMFGNETHIYSGVRLTIPLGQMKYVPNGSEVTTRLQPMGRGAGQLLDNPESLYRVTEPVSYRRTHRSWHRLLD